MNKYIMALFFLLIPIFAVSAGEVWHCGKLDYSSSAMINKWELKNETTLNEFSFAVSDKSVLLKRDVNSEKMDVIYTDDTRMDMILKGSNSTEVFTLLKATKTLLYAKTSVDISKEKGWVAFGHAECKITKE